jgi:hypothetical protein
MDRAIPAVVAAVVLLAGCATTAADRKATLVTADAATMAALTSGLARAMGTARVTLGPGDLTVMSEVAVLPPPPGPYETRSLAEPTIFTLVLRGDACMAIRRDDGVAHPLPGVRCRPAG